MNVINILILYQLKTNITPLLSLADKGKDRGNTA